MARNVYGSISWDKQLKPPDISNDHVCSYGRYEKPRIRTQSVRIGNSKAIPGCSINSGIQNVYNGNAAVFADVRLIPYSRNCRIVMHADLELWKHAFHFHGIQARKWFRFRGVNGCREYQHSKD